MPVRYGYYRVSTADQCPDLQVSALKQAGCDVIMGDVGFSGVKDSRPSLDAMLERLKPGDSVCVWKLDRISRSLRHLIDLNARFEETNVTFSSLTEQIDTSTPMGKFVFHILSAVAELERDMISQRTRAGLAEAARRGRFPGRPRKIGAYRYSNAA